MSSVGQGLGMVAGAVVGFYVPAVGVALGASIGGMVGGYLDPPKGPHTEGPRLSDTAQQTSAYGVDIPRGYGSNIYAANVFWIENNRLREVSTDESVGGKGGGGGATTTTYAYYFTGAASLREVLPGQTVALRRLYLGGQLFYDAGSDDFGAILASNQNSQYFTFYNGAADQLPDDRMQATLGAGDVPAFRGLAYIVFKDLPMEKYQKAIAGLQIRADLVDSTIAPASQIISTLPWPTGENLAEDISVRWETEHLIRNFLIHTVDYSLVSNCRQDAHFMAASMEIGRSELPPYTDDAFTTKIAIRTAQTDEECTLVHMFKMADLSKIVKFDVAGNVVFDTGYMDSSYIPYPVQRAIVDRGDIYLFYDATKVYKIDAGGVIGSTVAAYDAFFGGASENYLFLVSKQTYPAKVYKIARADLSLAETITQNIVSTEMRISVVSDTLFYTLANTGASNRPVYRWDNGVATDTGLRYSGLFNSYLWFKCSADDVAYVLETNTSTMVSQVYGLFKQMSEQTSPLAEIIESECLLSRMLEAGDIDTSAITAEVRGYEIARVASIRSALEPLQAVWPFDIIPSGYQLKFVPRGGASVATIDASELDARSSGESPGVRITRSIEMDSQLPRKVVVNYRDPSREYEPGPPGVAVRKGTTSETTRKIDMTVVLTADEAVGVAEQLLRMYWVERDELSFVMPPPRRGIEAGDVVNIVDDVATYSVRMEEIEAMPDARLRCRGKFAHAAVYSPVALGQAGMSSPPVMTLAGDSVAVLLDIPCALSSVQNAYGFPAAMAGYLSGWPGGTLAASPDGGQTWIATEGFTPPPAAIGIVINSSTVARTDIKDAGPALSVSLYGNATLSSVSESQMLNGINYFAYGVDGRWEIIACQNCEQQPDGSWLLYDRLRGRFGTEWAVALHQPYDLIVRLDSAAMHFVGSNLQSINVDKLYRAVTNGRTLGQATDIAFSYDAVNLKPLAPVYGNGSRHPTTNDWSGTFIPRTRIGGEWVDGRDALLAEASEAYKVEVWDSGYTTLKRTINVSTPDFSYPSSDQLADFGVVQSSIYLKAAQLSAVVGAGYGLNFSLSTTLPIYGSVTPDVEYLVVGGGGSGGYSSTGNSYAGAGGGAGGVLAGSGYVVTAGVSITVTVGSGGIGTTSTTNNGQDSVFGTLTAIGGGAGARGAVTSANGNSGGSGGGSSDVGTVGAGTSGQGHAGGFGAVTWGTAGGGGGAGAVGSGDSSGVAGSGGAGIASSISGSSLNYGGGGGSGKYQNTDTGGTASHGGGAGGTGNAGGGTRTAGSAASAFTGGGGGGGGGGNTGTAQAGGNGAAGVVIIRYPDSFGAAAYTTGAPTITVTGGYRIYTWTASGSITF